MGAVGNTLRGTWFSEVHDELWPGRALSLRVDRVLYEGRSELQRIAVVESTGVGRVLILDGVIQLTESDEFAYHEMLTHTPAFAHPAPRRALVIGGGDGGMLRELARHPEIESIEICEIDREVIEVSRRFLAFTACGFDDARVTVHVEDGAAFVARADGCYDLIVVDSSDPVGPAEVLFREPFYRSLRRALAPGGIVATQAESIWLHEELIRSLGGIAARAFERSAYGIVTVPTYPSGQIGFLCATAGPDPRVPARPPDPSLAGALRYYSPAVHRAAFSIPSFAADWFAGDHAGSGA